MTDFVKQLEPIEQLLQMETDRETYEAQMKVLKDTLAKLESMNQRRMQA